MKLSFTTLACPQWGLTQILAAARSCRYDGIDFRGYRGEMEIFKLPEFTTGLDATRKQVERAGVEVSGLSSSVRLFGMPVAAAVEETRQYVRLCRALKAPIIRIYGGKLEGAEFGKALDVAAANLKTVSDAAEEVLLGIETHDDWVASDRVAQLVERVPAANVCVLWDVHHPYRLAGEDVQTTWKNIGRHVKYTHWKDSIAGADGKHKYTMPGEGTVPLREIFNTLKAGGYDGCLTVEWEKKWIPDLAEPEIALPAYAKYLRAMMGA